MRIRTTLALAAMGLALTAGHEAVAQDKVKLKVADSFPTTHYVPGFIKKWMEEVTAASGGMVEFEYYGAEQLGKAKDMLTLVQTGVTDVAYVAPSYVSEKMPLSSVAELPGGFATSCEGTRAYWKLATGDGIIAKREMQPNGVRLVMTGLGAPYQIISTKQFDGLASLSGQKLRSYGGHQDTALKDLGAVPVRMPAPEMYEAVTRGTLDGVVLPYASVFSYRLQDQVKFATTGQNFGSVALNYVMNERKWKSLPQKVKDALEKAGPAGIEYACQYMDRDADASAEKLRKGGVTMVKFNAEDQKAIDAKVKGIAPKWAADLDRRGKPGSETLKAFTAALGKSG